MKTRMEDDKGLDAGRRRRRIGLGSALFPFVLNVRNVMKIRRVCMKSVMFTSPRTDAGGNLRVAVGDALRSVWK